MTLNETETKIVELTRTLALSRIEKEVKGHTFGCGFLWGYITIRRAQKNGKVREFKLKECFGGVCVEGGDRPGVGRGGWRVPDHQDLPRGGPRRLWCSLTDFLTVGSRICYLLPMAEKPKTKWVNGILCQADGEPPPLDPETANTRLALASALGDTAWQKLLRDTRTWAKGHGFNLPEVVLVETAATILGEMLPEELRAQVQQRLFAMLVTKLDPRRRLGP